MKKIIDYLKYKEGDPLLVNILYSGGTYDLEGHYDFEVYGKATANGLSIEGRRRGYGKMELAVEKNASVVFWKIPSTRQTPENSTPVPDVPDYQDEHEKQMEYYVNLVLEKRGLFIPQAEGEGDSPSNDLDDIDLEDYDEDYYDFPLSTRGLIEDNVLPIFEEPALPETRGAGDSATENIADEDEEPPEEEAAG